MNDQSEIDFSDGFDGEEAIFDELFSIHQDVHALREDPDNLQLLLEVQRRIAVAVMANERRIRAAKKQGEDPSDWQFLRSNFLCLGDCLVFIYVDRFSVKHTYFNLDNPNPKQHGGFLSGKEGLGGEISFLDEAIRNEVPAVLCDLTNVIRYGDVCLLGESDPLPVEVKSAKVSDRRSKRQRKKLIALQDFYETDRAVNLRGVPGETRRVEYSSEPSSYSALLSGAIDRAMENGVSDFVVEDCLKIMVVSSADIDFGEILKDIDLKKTVVCFLNELKNRQAWGCYYPYGLSLRKSSHFSGFVLGEVSIIAFLDIDAFAERFSSDEVSVQIQSIEGELFCHIEFLNSLGGDFPAEGVIGEHMISRMWTDFLCPSWVVSNAVCSISNFPMLAVGPEVSGASSE